MSSYAELTLGSLYLAASRNGVDPDLMWLFRSNDKKIDHIDRRNRELLERYIMDEYIDDYDERNPLVRVRYSCTASVARDRLELKGFTYGAAETSFNAGLEHEVQIHKSIETPGHAIHDEQHRILRSLSARGWVEALGHIRKEVLTEEALHRPPLNDVELPLLRYMLDKSFDQYGFPEIESVHIAHFVRLAVEAVPPQEQLVYDLTSLVGSDWINEADDQVANSETRRYAHLHLAQRVVVLTEGVADRRVLKRSLGLLYPHLSDYFHFFEFTGKKGAGGAGELANLVRAFAAAGVRHRILSLCLTTTPRLWRHSATWTRIPFPRTLRSAVIQISP